MDFLQQLLTAIVNFDFAPLKSLIDLNDLRNIAAILGVAITVMAASKKWGTKAVYFATIGASLNKPLSLTSLSITNLKDKPLIIYQIVVVINRKKLFFKLQEFDPPLVIKGLEATSLVPKPYSKLEIEPNPFLDPKLDIELILITESTAIKCKAAKSPERIVYKHMKKIKPITVTRKIFNKKIYTNDTALALVYMYQGVQHTSFLLKNGLICDEWPFQTNKLSKDEMQDKDTIQQALTTIAEKYDVHINISELI